MEVVNFSERIRAKRPDLTDYLVHLTKARQVPRASAFEVLVEILHSGFIKPTFAYYQGRNGSGIRAAIKGPYPAVCLTEQPLSAILATLPLVRGRYSPYGIAYYKATLFDQGGRPVLYGSGNELGHRIENGKPGWEEGREVHEGGLPPEMQYLWVKYDPLGIGNFNYAVDFTWEREWRVRFPSPNLGSAGLPVALRNPWSKHGGAILVSTEDEVAIIRSCLSALKSKGVDWTQYIETVISLDFVRSKLDQGDTRYGRLESWPNDE